MEVSVGEGAPLNGEQTFSKHTWRHWQHLKPSLTVVGARCHPEASSIGRENEMEGGLEIILEKYHR